MKERLEYIVRSSNLLSITSPTLSEVTAADNASPPSPEVIVVKRNSLVFPDDWEVTGQDWSDRTLVQISFNIIALSLNWFKLPTSTLPLQNSTPSLTPPPPTSPLLPTGHEVDTLGAFVRFVSANSALDLQLLLILDEIRLLDSVDISHSLNASTVSGARQSTLDAIKSISSACSQARTTMLNLIGSGDDTIKEMERHEREAERERVEAKKRNRISRDWEFTRSPLGRSTSASGKRRTWTALDFESVESTGMARARSEGIQNGSISAGISTNLTPRSPYASFPATHERSNSRPLSMSLGSSLNYSSQHSPDLQFRRSITTLPLLDSPMLDADPPLSLSNLAISFDELHLKRRQLVWTILGVKPSDYLEASGIVDEIEKMIGSELKKLAEVVKESFSETIGGLSNIRMKRKRGTQRIRHCSPSMSHGFAPRNQDNLDLASWDMENSRLLDCVRAVAAKLLVITSHVQSIEGVDQPLESVHLLNLHDSIRLDLEDISTKWSDSRVTLRKVLKAEEDEEPTSELDVGVETDNLNDTSNIERDESFSFIEKDLFDSHDNDLFPSSEPSNTLDSSTFDSDLPPSDVEEVYESTELHMSTNFPPVERLDRTERIRLAKLDRELVIAKGIPVELAIIEEMKAVLVHRSNAKNSSRSSESVGVGLSQAEPL